MQLTKEKIQKKINLHRFSIRTMFKDDKKIYRMFLPATYRNSFLKGRYINFQLQLKLPKFKLETSCTIMTLLLLFFMLYKHFSFMALYSQIVTDLLHHGVMLWGTLQFSTTLNQIIDSGWYGYIVVGYSRQMNQKV